MKSLKLKVAMLFVIMLSVITLFACNFGTKNYTISFIANGGSKVASVAIVEGGVIESVPISVKDGVEFGGWYTNSTFEGEKATFPFAPTKNLVFYAKWVEHNYGAFTVTADGHQQTCSTCGASSGLIPHEFGEFQADESNHFKKCVCGFEVENDIHTLIVHNNNNNNDTHIIACEKCNYTKEEAHEMGVWYSDKITLTRTDEICGFETSAVDQLTYVLNADDESWEVVANQSPKANAREHVIVPTYVDNKLVTGIRTGAFEKYKAMITVTMPESVVNVGKNAFWENVNGTIVFIEHKTRPDGWDAEWLGYGGSGEDYIAVVWDSKNNNIDNNGFILTKLNDVYYRLKDGEAIVHRAEFNVTDVVFVEVVVYNKISYTLKKIENYAFRLCEGITNITFPQTIANIGDRAFYGCTGLTSLYIPETVEYIGAIAFGKCTGLESITLPFIGASGSGSAALGEGSALAHIFSEGQQKVPSSIKTVTVTGGTIGERAFMEELNITSITLPNNITKIGILAFYGCTGLISLRIPETVTYIDIDAFNLCKNIASIEIPRSVNTISSRAFGNWTGEQTIYFPGKTAAPSTFNANWASTCNATIKWNESAPTRALPNSVVQSYVNTAKQKEDTNLKYVIQ